MSLKHNFELEPNEPACPSAVKFHNNRKEIFEDIYSMMALSNCDNNKIIKTLQKKWGISQKHARVMLNDAMSDSGYHKYFGSDATIILNAFKEVVKEAGCNMESVWSYYTSLKYGTIKDFTTGRQQIPVPLQNNFYDYMNIKLTDGQLVQKNLIPSKPYEPCENCIHKGTGNCAICLVTQYKLKQKLNMCRTTLNEDAKIIKKPQTIKKIEDNKKPVEPEKITVVYLPKFVGIPNNIKNSGERVIQKQSIKNFIPHSIRIEFRPVVKSDKDCMGRTVFETYEEAEQTLHKYLLTGNWK